MNEYTTFWSILKSSAAKGCLKKKSNKIFALQEFQNGNSDDVCCGRCTIGQPYVKSYQIYRKWILSVLRCLNCNSFLIPICFWKVYHKYKFCTEDNESEIQFFGATCKHCKGTVSIRLYWEKLMSWVKCRVICESCKLIIYERTMISKQVLSKGFPTPTHILSVEENKLLRCGLDMLMDQLRNPGKFIEPKSQELSTIIINEKKQQAIRNKWKAKREKPLPQLIAYFNNEIESTLYPLTNNKEDLAYLKKKDQRRPGLPEDYGLTQWKNQTINFGSVYRYEICQSGDFKVYHLNRRFHRKVNTTCQCKDSKKGYYCDWQHKQKEYKWSTMCYLDNVDYDCNGCNRMFTFFPNYDQQSPRELISQHETKEYIIVHAILCPECYRDKKITNI